MKEIKDEDFMKRRLAARERLSDLAGNEGKDPEERSAFFEAVYNSAEGDTAQVPWADLAARPELQNWLDRHNGEGRLALDIACGLGDNAEAMAAAGYKTAAFDVVDEAVSWAKRRFLETKVAYEVQDLFNLPEGWLGCFELVHECYTLQALPEAMIEKTAEAICSTVAPGGTLLIYTRIRDNGADVVAGPPWPLQEKHLKLPEKFGLTLIADSRFSVEMNEKAVPHSFSEWVKEGR